MPSFVFFPCPGCGARVGPIEFMEGQETFELKKGLKYIPVFCPSCHAYIPFGKHKEDHGTGQSQESSKDVDDDFEA